VTQKFSRNDLKVLVKECLMEILQDGLRESVSRPSRPMQENAQLRSEPEVRRSTRDKMSFLPDREQIQRKPSAPSRALAEGIASITSDPIMREILGDTASTTLVEQMGAESRSPVAGGPRDAASSVVAQSDPMDLFSGSADKWASLAFADPIGRH